MPRPFQTLRDEGLSRDELRQKRVIEHDFDLLEHFFYSAADSPKRLKSDPMRPVSTPASVRDLSVAYALRALELTEGAALSIEHQNVTSSLPIVRAIHELFYAVLYVQCEFSRCIDAGDPERFAKTARRLRTARSTDPESESGYPVKVSRMKHIALEHLRSLDKKWLTTDPADAPPDVIASHLSRTYDELSDGTHPTQWSMTMYTHERSDGLGFNWSRKADRSFELIYGLVHVALPLGLLRRFIPNLPTLADRAEGLA